jgi:hypothetical protein
VAAVVGGAVGALRMVVGGAGCTVSRVPASLQARGLVPAGAKIRAAGSLQTASRSSESNTVALTIQ